MCQPAVNSYAIEKKNLKTGFTFFTEGFQSTYMGAADRFWDVANDTPRTFQVRLIKGTFDSPGGCLLKA